MSQIPSSVSLRYFDITGRAQPLRDLLHDASVDFEDIRESRASGIDGSWAQKSSDPQMGGPFGTLPVLQWGDVQVAQTEAIAWFLGQHLGYGGSNIETSARVMALCSAAHQDLVQPLGMLLWQPVMYPNIDLKMPAGLMLDRILKVLKALEKQIGDDSYFLGKEPTTGDFFVYEAVWAVADVFGSSILADHERLKTWMNRIESRPRLQNSLANRPEFFTSCPIESETRAQLKAWFSPE